MNEMNRQECEANLAAEWNQWNQKKRPATPFLRAQLLDRLREQRAARFTRADGGALTPEDWRHIRQVQRESHRKFRSFCVALDAEAERSFWDLLKEFGITTEGGVQ